MAVFVDDTGKSWFLMDDESAAGAGPSVPGSGPAKNPLAVADPAKLVDPNDPIQTAPASIARPPEAAPAPAGLGVTSVGPQAAPAPAAGPQTAAQKVEAFIRMGSSQPAAAPGAAPAPGAPGAAPGPKPAVGGDNTAAPGNPAPLANPPPLGEGTLQLAGSNTTQSRDVVKGRDLKKTQAQIAAEEKAGAAGDTALMDSGLAKDQRAANALDKEKQGLEDTEERNRNRVIDEQLRQQAVKDSVDKLNVELKANDESLDNDRYIKNMSSGSKIGMVILAALNGGFGKLAGQNGNVVLDTLNQNIQRDIDKQKAEIASGKTRIGNDIAEFRRKGFSAEQAETLARDRADSAADAKILNEAKREGVSGENAEAMRQMVSQRQEQRALRRGDMLKETEDRVSTHWQKTDTLQQRAPTGGPLAGLKDALEIDAALEKGGWTREQRAAYLSARGLAPPTGETAAERAAREKGKEGGKMNEQEAKAEAAAAAMKDFGTLAGLVRATEGPNKGKWVVGSGFLSPRFKEDFVNDVTFGLSSEPVKYASEAAREALGRSLSGAGMKDEEIEAQKNLLGEGSTTRQQLADRLNSAETLNESKRSAQKQAGARDVEAAGFRPK